MPIDRPGVSPLLRLRSISGLLQFLLLAILVSLSACQNDYVVVRQVTGPNNTNAYLLYEVESGRAALFDVAGPIDSLIAEIDRKGLEVEYIFTTHGHPDHVQGLPGIRSRYPQARWGMSHEEFEDLSIYARLEEELPPDAAANLRAAAEQDPAFAEMLAFDLARLGQPDHFLEDGEVYRLGALEIHTFHTPGHSRGSICFHAGNALFSGDLLFQGRAGRVDLPGSGGAEAISGSVRRLYEILPEETIVYPGHGELTDIGTEKLQGTGIYGEPGAEHQIDHIIVGINDLHIGTVRVQELTGVAPIHDGRHPSGGTQNALLSLGERVYLEVLAPQSDAELGESWQRLSALDSLTPIGFAVSTTDIQGTAALLRNNGYVTSEPASGSRALPDGGVLRWTVMEIMEPAVSGAPFFIQWDVRSPHPATTSPGGCALQSLTVLSAQRVPLDRLFNALELGVLVEDGDTQDAEFRFQLSCPAGPVQLR